MSRRELKENLLAARVEKGLRWAMARRGPILISVGVVIAVMLLSSVVVLRKQQERETIETQMAIAQSLIAQKKFDQSAAMLKTMRPTVTDRKLASRLLYLEGTALLSTQNFDDAIAAFREASDLSAGTPLRPLVLSNLGFAQEQKKDYTGAAASYSQFMADYGNHFLAPRIQLSLGRTLYAAGKPDDARKALGQLIDLYPTSAWAQSARQIMERYK
jgi:TolA-binding protein